MTKGADAEMLLHTWDIAGIHSRRRVGNSDKIEIDLVFNCEGRAFATLPHQNFHSAGRGDIQNINVNGEPAAPVGQGNGESAETWQPAGFGHFFIERLKELLPRARRQRGQDYPP